MRPLFRLYSICMLAVLMTASPVMAKSSDDKTDDKTTMQYLELFGDVLDKVKQDYVEKVKDKELIESAINGMLTSLDPHSSYLNEKAFQEMQIQTRGEFGGLGIEVTMENGLVKVVSPIDDTPAFKAGIKAGDYISHIDDTAVMGLTLSQAVDKMRGKPDTKIKLTVLRKGESAPLHFTITRDVIKIKSVRAHQEGDVIYARITSFSEKTGQALKKAIRKYKKEIGPDLKGLVLDLRNNPGGLLDQAIEVSDLFINQGEILSIKGRVPDSNKRFNATNGDMLDGLPMVVIINRGSASASEIVSGALQDHKRAVIIGERSFGKGSVQTVIPLSASNGAMRLTTSRYYTPSGRSIQAEGIEPDIEVDQATIQDKKQKGDTSEASLSGHLVNGTDETSKSEKEKKEAEKQALKKTYSEDYQLGRAVDLIHALYLVDNKQAAK